MAVHQEHVMMINGWSEALGVNLVAVAYVSVAHSPASRPPSVLLLGYALTDWTHTPPTRPEVRMSDTITYSLFLGEVSQDMTSLTVVCKWRL